MVVSSTDYVEVRVIGLLFACWYCIRFVDKMGMYSCILSWQMTIWSLHVAPILGLRCLDLTETSTCVMSLIWLLFSWHCRRWQCSIFSLLFLVLEISAIFVELAPRALGVMCVLQVIIVVGFWGGILVASCSSSFSFMPLDRHLKLGLVHVLWSPEGCRCFLHEIVGHLLAEVLLISMLSPHLKQVPVFDLLVDVSLVLGAYSLLVVAVAAALPPHELPYCLGELPKALQQPVTLPSWLAGDGANGSFDRCQLPWWFKAPAEDSIKRTA